MIPQVELADQYDIHGTFLLSHFLTRVLFKFECIIFIFVVASCVKGLGLEIEILEKPSYVSCGPTHCGPKGYKHIEV